MGILLFEDDRVDQLSPITMSRPAYAIQCGGYRLVDLIANWNPPTRGIVRPHLIDIQRHDFPELADTDFSADDPLLLINARVPPAVSTLEKIKRWFEHQTSPAAIRRDDQPVAAVLPAGAVTAPPDSVDGVVALLESDTVRSLPVEETNLSLFEYPHDVVRHHQEICRENFEHRIEHGDFREVADGVFLAKGATVGEYVVTDAKKGPIVLDAGATVGPYCYLSGPAYLGPNSRVIEHAAIKDNVSSGHTTKIGGEVEASIIEAYTNKQHHGFLGHSYLGSWINLGAGTCNSDLKNTYGEVKMDYAGQRVATGMQFLGAIIGDYSKTAVNTSIFTGKTIGVCSMVYGYVTTNVSGFCNYARLFGQETVLPPEVMIATQARMFARRNVPQRPCDKQLVIDMFALTQPEDHIRDEPLTW
jgi:UDP-N-acetylglucosamine diphosphorylase/glucosamine-1-phosphate N-acetyltransferase